MIVHFDKVKNLIYLTECYALFFNEYEIEDLEDEEDDEDTDESDYKGVYITLEPWVYGANRNKPIVIKESTILTVVEPDQQLIDMYARKVNDSKKLVLQKEKEKQKKDKKKLFQLVVNNEVRSEIPNNEQEKKPFLNLVVNNTIQKEQTE